ncbi:MAG: DUF488 domain-containing protein [Bradymonadaceae bacterium]
MSIELKRAYDAPDDSDGRRVLVDKFWPRGVTKEEAALDEWRREVAPSDELREWFDHDPDRFDSFRDRYCDELENAPDAWRPLLEAARERTVTLVYGASDREHNHAVVLRDFLLDRLDGESD